MIDYQYEAPEYLFAEINKSLNGIKEQKMPSLRIAHDVDRREFELNYANGAISLSMLDGSPVNPGIGHIVDFWMKMLKLPSSPASIEMLHARLMPSDKPLQTLSPIYLLMTISVIGRRPTHLDWPEELSTTAFLKVAFEEFDGEAVAYPEITLEYDERLKDRSADLELLLEQTAHYWSYFCHYAAPWFTDSGVTDLEMVVPIMGSDHPYFSGRAS